MNTFRPKHTFMDDLAGADGGGGGAAAPAAAPASGAAPGAAGGDAGAAGAGTGDAASLLQQGLQGAAAAGGADPMAWLTEQHKVLGADGKVDEAASARKQAESYSALAKRMRETGAPPKTADDYKFEVPEALKGSYDPAKDTALGEFRAAALEMGLTPKQFQGVMERYTATLPQLAEQLFESNRAKGEADLKTQWKSDDQMTAGLRNAATAVKGFDPGAMNEKGEIAEDSPLRSLMNNAYFLRMAAHFGAQMQEDTSPNTMGALPAASPYRGMTRPQLETHEAYLNPRHPDHLVISKMVQESYHKETGEDLMQ